jgi:hypothetical protein
MTLAEVAVFQVLLKEVAEVDDARIDAKPCVAAIDALQDEITRLRQGILDNAATLVKWAIAAGGHTPSAIIAGRLRELVESKEN